MIINVTQDHIDSGLPNRCMTCPVALAIQDSLPKLTSQFIIIIVKVNTIGVRIYKNELIQSIQLPNSAVLFIDDFDNNKPVKPFSFELDYE